MQELLYIAIMGLSVILFALGGTGFKWARRFLLPSLLGVCLYFIGVNIIQILLSMGILCGAMCLGYGESTNWPLKFFVGVSYAMPSLILGYSLWVFIVPVAFIAMFFLSNWDATKKSFTWKLVEGAYGFLIAASLIGALSCPWLK